jgi:exopolyphosphatase/guanosine-5'-triphosphate,3'-diphosphate pyrophosphatase
MSPIIEKYLLAIDIGSNAMRATLAVSDSSNDLDIIENFRYPLRLGDDVFQKGRVSNKKIQSIDEAFIDLSEVIREYKIKSVKAIATSALRDAANGQDICEKIFLKHGIKIEIISGEREANLIKNAIESSIELKNKRCLLIDIGGGSTEIIVTQGSDILYEKSFQCGTVRLLQEPDEAQIKKMATNLTKELSKDLKNKKIGQQFNITIGTGGNLRRIGKLRKVFFKRSYRKITQSELSAISSEVKKFSLNQRVSFLNMRKDRADVIVPAMIIIEEIMIKLDILEIHLPHVGLKEGILLEMIPKKPRFIYYR